MYKSSKQEAYSDVTKTILTNKGFRKLASEALKLCVTSTREAAIWMKHRLPENTPNGYKYTHLNIEPALWVIKDEKSKN